MKQPRLTARINTVKVSIEDCIKELQNLGWTIEQDKDIPEVVYIDSHQGHLEKAKPVIEGHITFMDKASMLVAM